MPLISIYPSAAFIKQLHEYLIEVYREELQPKHIEPGYTYEGLIDGVAERIAFDKSYEGKPYRHFLERVAYCLYHLNRGHPFSDGNKRTSLLVAYYFLLWNTGIS
jgi:prophage maintenance system killer protein